MLKDSRSRSNSGLGMGTNTKLSVVIAVSRAKAAFSQRYRSRSRGPNDLTRHKTYTLFDCLPVELLAHIFSQVNIPDLLSLQRTSRSFRDVVDQNTSLIVRHYIRYHRLEELARLFPPQTTPSIVNGNGLPKYDLRYLFSLTGKEQLCLELSGHLTERVLQRGFGVMPARPGRSGRKRSAAGIGGGEEVPAGLLLLQDLAQRLYHILHFLSSYSRCRQHTLEKLSIHSTLITSLHPQTPIPTPSRSTILLDFQLSVLSTLPDNLLLQVHHAMHLLIKHMRLSTCPEPPHQKNDPWISMLLHKSGLGRINEFFAADGPYASHSVRRAFTKAMQRDFDELENNNRGNNGNDGDRDGERDIPPPIREIWFDAAQEVLRRRGLETHAREVVVLEAGRRPTSIDGLECSGCRS